MQGALQGQLEVLSAASRALAEARTLEDIAGIRNKAEAVRQYARSAALGLEIQNHAAEIKLRAERKAGRLLSQLALQGGDRKSKSRDERVKLADLGINHNQSARWQLEASVPDDVFEDFLARTKSDSRELTSHSVIRLATQLTAVASPARSERPSGVVSVPFVAAHNKRSCRAGRDAHPNTGDCDHTYILNELQNHCRQLRTILAESYLRDVVRHKDIQRTTVIRLLEEIEELLSELERQSVCE